MRTFAMAGSLSRGSSALFLHPKYDVLLLTAKPVWQCGLSLLVRDVRSHGPGIPKCGISAGSGGRFGVFEAKVVSIPGNHVWRDGDGSLFRVLLLLPKHANHRAWSYVLAEVWGDACDALGSLIP